MASKMDSTYPLIDSNKSEGLEIDKLGIGTEENSIGK